MRDRIVGEVLPLEGRWYQCRVEREEGSCDGCALDTPSINCSRYTSLGCCTAGRRADGQGVIFVEIEKP